MAKLEPRKPSFPEKRDPPTWMIATGVSLFFVMLLLARSGAGIRLAAILFWLTVIGAFAAWVAGRFRGKPALAPPDDDWKPLRGTYAQLPLLDYIDKKMIDRAVRQMDQAIFQIHEYRVFLDSHFDREELTYTRYRAVGDKFEASLRHGFEKNAELFLRLSVLDPSSQSNSFARTEAKKEIDAFLADTDRALGSLSQAVHALTKLETSRSRKAGDLPSAIEELEELAQRAGKYSS